MDLYYKQEVSVGALVLVAIAIFVGGVIWLTGSSVFAGGTTPVNVRFVDVTGLQVGDPVQVSGFRVGRVQTVDLVEVGRILVRIEVPIDLSPRVDAIARIGALDFLGAKFVDYQPGTSSTMLPEGQVLSGTVTASPLDGAAELADRATGVMTGLQSVVAEDMVTELRETMQAAQAALGVVEEIGDGPAVREATAALAAMRQVAQRLDSILAATNLAETMGKVSDMSGSAQGVIDGLATATVTLNAVLQRLDNGEGLVGKVMTDSTLHTDMHLLMESMRQLLDDMRERPGRYFRLTVF